MPLDPTIALQVRPPADPLEGYGRALTLKGLLGQQQMQDAQIAAAQRQRDEETTLADLYRQSLGSDGQVNRSAVLRGAADRGLGARIPGLQKQWLDADKAGADLAHTQAQTGKLGAETAGLQIKAEADRAGYVVDLVSRLAGRPNVTHDDIIAELTAVRGIGVWTAEMFLIFNQMRPDVFPLDDIGLQRAVALHYFDGQRPLRRQLAEFGERWRPWRSVATWYLWRSLDPVPVEY